MEHGKSLSRYSACEKEDRQKPVYKKKPDFEIIGNRAAIQMMKTALDDPDGKAKDIIKMLKAYLGEDDEPRKPCSYGIGVIKYVLSQLEGISPKTDLINYWIARARKVLPPPAEEPSELRSRKIHSIWIQGDYNEVEDSQAAIDTRLSAQGYRWENIIWVYRQVPPDASEESAVRPVELRGKTGVIMAQEKNFRQVMAAWEDRPPWVERFLPILDILFMKKGYVAMSDIMRMIILYYEGGLYVDIKIKFAAECVRFLDQPMLLCSVPAMAQLPDLSKENWAMLAEAGCQMIASLMEETLSRMPTLEKLESMPENYVPGQPYSRVHKDFHEQLGPWKSLSDHSGEIPSIQDLNPAVGLENPYGTKHSWDDDDGEAGFW